jgi:hypothetical protein
VKGALIREIFHQMLIGNYSIASLTKHKKLIGSFNTVSDNLLRETVHDLCSRRTSSMGGNQGNTGNTGFDMLSTEEEGESSSSDRLNMQLKEESYLYYDPEFINLNGKQLNIAMDKVKDCMKSILSSSSVSSPVVTASRASSKQEKIRRNHSYYHQNPYFPLLFYQALPLCHPDFNIVRCTVVFSSTFLEILRICLKDLCLTINPSRKVENCITLIGRIIQLLTLQCYFLIDPITNEINPSLKGIMEDLYSQENKIGYNLIECLLEIWKKELLKEEFLYHEGLQFFLFESASFHSDIVELLKKHSFIISKEESGKVDGEEKDGKRQETIKIDSKEAMKNAAKDRLFAQTKLNAENAMKAFADLMSDDSDDDDDDEDEDADTEAGDEETEVSDMMTEIEPRKSKKKVKKVEEMCIICKEKRENAPLGYLSFIQSSNVLKHISNHYYLPLNSSLSSQSSSPAATAFSQFHHIYRVVARDGCQVFSHPSLPSTSASSSASTNSLHYSYHGEGLLGTIPFNESVYVNERKGNWIHIVSPINGYALLFKPNDIPAYAPSSPLYNEEIPVTENSLSVISSFSKQYRTILSPITNFLYNNNSGTRLYGKESLVFSSLHFSSLHFTSLFRFDFLSFVVLTVMTLFLFYFSLASTCNHAMHIECWDHFFAASYARIINHDRGADYQGYDVNKGECLCPLCKTILNCIVPISSCFNNRESEMKDEMMDLSPVDSSFQSLLSMTITATSSSSVDGYFSQYASLIGIRTAKGEAIYKNFMFGNMKRKQYMISSVDERNILLRFLDGITQKASSIVSFYPFSLQQATSFSSSKNGTFKFDDFYRLYDSDMKLFHSILLTIQSTAYSLSMSSYQNLSSFLSSSNTNSEATSNNEGGLWEISSNDKNCLKELVGLLSKASSLFHSSAFYSFFYEQSLLALFFPSLRNSSLNESTSADLLDSLLTSSAALASDEKSQFFSALSLVSPFSICFMNSSYFTSQQYPDIKTFLELISSLFQVFKSSPQLTEANEMKLFSSFYSLFSSFPFLSQDLTIVLITCIPFISQLSTKKDQWKLWKEFISILIIGKVNQILIDPQITKIFSSPTTSPSSFIKSSAGAPVTTDLQQLETAVIEMQKIVYKSLHLPFETDKQDNAMILDYLFQSLIPFLEIIMRLLQLLDLSEEDIEEDEKGNHSKNKKSSSRFTVEASERFVIQGLLSEGKAGSSSKGTISQPERNSKLSVYVNYLHSQLSIPSLVDLLQNPVIMSLLINPWNSYYHSYHTGGYPDWLLIKEK